MFIIVNRASQSLGLPAYKSRKAAMAAADALTMVMGEVYGVSFKAVR